MDQLVAQSAEAADLKPAQYWFESSVADTSLVQRTEHESSKLKTSVRFWWDVRAYDGIGIRTELRTQVLQVRLLLRAPGQNQGFESLCLASRRVV